MERSFSFYDSEGYHFISLCMKMCSFPVSWWGTQRYRCGIRFSTWRTVMGGEWRCAGRDKVPENSLREAKLLTNSALMTRADGAEPIRWAVRCWRWFLQQNWRRAQKHPCRFLRRQVFNFSHSDINSQKQPHRAALLWRINPTVSPLLPAEDWGKEIK